MQPELPWNVAGIAPEARDAARASARREGLSVGEWLTRRILRNLDESTESSVDIWRAPPTNGYRTAREERAPGRESASVLALVSRGESETESAWHRIEEQLKGVARRLDQTERSQSESNRAVSQAAAEINHAAREQAQAFDQLAAHVVSLNERLKRVEQRDGSDGYRGAVKALHQGLSHLADQVAETSNRSTAQAAQLAANIETVAARLTESRGDGQENWRALEERVGTLAANVGAIAGKLLESRGDAERILRTLDGRIAEMAERVRGAEETAQANAGAVEKTLEGIESALASRRNDEAEIRRHAEALAEFSGAIDNLSRQFAAREAEQNAAISSLGDRVAKLPPPSAHSELDQRLESVEHGLARLTDRIDKSDRTRFALPETMEEELRNLAERLDAGETRSRQALDELGASVKDVRGKLADLHVASLPPLQGAVPIFDLPPFQDALPPFPDALPPDGPEPLAPPPLATPAAFDPIVGAAPLFGAESFASSAAANSSISESFLAAARRTARAATSTQAEQARRNAFLSWVAPQASEHAADDGSRRFVLLVGLGVLIVAAIAAGVFLSRNLTPSPAPVTKSIAAPHVLAPAPLRAQPVAAETAQTVASVPPAAAAPQIQPAPGASDTNIAPPPPAAAPVAHARPAPAHVRATAGARPPPLQVAAPPPPPAQLAISQQSPTAAGQDRLAALANTGSGMAEELLGLRYLDGDGVAVNEAEAAKWLERAAKQGEAVAAYRLGTLYERGHGVPADAAKAAQWYGAAAKAGNRKAMHNLAVAYAQGTGVDKNLVLAAQWFSRAADLGLADSQYNLAVLYERGMGVGQSLPDAYKWYTIAAAQGDAESKAREDALATQLAADAKAAAEKAAADFRPQPLDRTANTPPDMASVAGG